MRSPIRALSYGIIASFILCASVQAQISDNPSSPKSAHQPIVELADQIVDTANTWLRWYGDLPPIWLRALERSAVAVASTRRSALKYLIEKSPERALADRLGRADRVGLSTKIVAMLEVEVDDYGRYRTRAFLHHLDPQTGEFTSEEVPSSLTVGKLRFINPSIYGRRADLTTNEDVPVHGIALDDAFAWSDSLYRLLDDVELKENQVPVDHIGLFVGNDLEIFPLDDTSLEEFFALLYRHYYIFLPDLWTYWWTRGEKRILWLPVDFPEAPGSRYTESANTDAMIAGANEWLESISRGRTTLSHAYFPGVLRLGSEALAGTSVHPTAVLDYVDEALAAYDAAHGGTGRWTETSYDRIVVVVSDAITAFPPGSYSDARGRYSLFYGLAGDFEWLLKHELGHTYGFGHSLYLRPDTSDPVGPGVVEYAQFDLMGQPGGSDPRGDIRNHPPTSFKGEAGWLDATEIADGTPGGSFRIVAHDNGPAGSVRAIRVVAADGREYWVDMRRLWPEEVVLHEGVQIHYFVPEIGNDTLVGPPFVAGNAYVGGETFEDTGRGVRIHVDATGRDGAGLFADVTVERF